MLPTQENAYLCSVGPESEMGRLLRRYWVPAFPAADLPHPDSPPIPVRLLGENFVAFRDTNGRLGLLDELCMHRGASLTLGRVEDCGIRCIYHGWKFAADGTILETPNMVDSRFKDRLRAPAYPVREAGGLAWVYLGPTEKEPEFPNYFWFGVPEERRVVSQYIMNCNWVQVQEGSLDSSHVGVLHLDGARQRYTGPNRATGIKGGFTLADNAPKIDVENTDFGFHYAALRQEKPGEFFVRVTPFIMPFMTYIPPQPGGIVIVVPRDDQTTSGIGVSVNLDGPVDPDSVRQRSGTSNPDIWGPELERRWVNIPKQDRAAMAAGDSFAGVAGARMQDYMVHASMGQVFDRSIEHVVPADVAVIRLRSLLIESARLVEEGGDPVGVSRHVDTEKIQTGSGVIRSDTPWQSLVPGNQPIDERLAGR